jgi:RNA polymerase sigma-70 factor (ECF subfamily)
MESFDSTCWTVVRGAAAGLAEARETFSRAYGSVISSYLAARWKLSVHHEEVADATQEVFLQCFKPGGALEKTESDRPGGFRAFLYGVARNVALMTERSRSRRRDRAIGELNLDGLEQSEATLSHAFDRAWAEMIARQARELMAQRAAQRGNTDLAYRCLELRYLHGKAPRDMAPMIDRTVEQVYELLRTARRQYQAALMEVMAHHHPGSTAAALEHKCRELTSLL